MNISIVGNLTANCASLKPKLDWSAGYLFVSSSADVGWPVPIRVVGTLLSVWAMLGLAKTNADDKPIRIMIIFDIKHLRLFNRNQIGCIPPEPSVIFWHWQIPSSSTKQ
jgi:hypothetical protein